MTSKSKPLGLLLIGTLAALLLFAQTNNWKFITEKEGISVYAKEVAGSKIKALKVRYSMNASLTAVVALLLDIDASTQWVYHTKSCTLLRKVSPTELYYYSEVSLPWPLENRDFVAHLTLAQNNATKVVTIDGPVVAGWVPVKPGIVRVSQSSGHWLLTPLGNGFTSIEYTLQTDPGGVIPAWLVNMFATQGPIESFKKMKLQLQLPKYRQAKLDFIKE